MLSVKHIVKSYKTGDFIQKALDDVSVKFRSSEFVCILGSSGSGKTTFLNIIGGLDKYDSGDLIINGKSTKRFKDRDWDSYRNNSVGFIFQSYNLISHISILSNVELGMTLSGVSRKERKEKARDALCRVGLLDHANKKPNQLSGGQMQRVAIARALVNDPDIILADEPTGALDSVTSVQIMDLIKEISKDKLVIMVTHNSELAKEYSSRIISLKDGKIVDDSNPYDGDDSSVYSFRKTSMSFITALKLSLTNIITKKGRTLLTSFASSIGIIGIALILSLSNGFQEKIDEFERDSLSQMPITISEQAIEMSELMSTSDSDKYHEYTSEKFIVPKDDTLDKVTHVNKITSSYVSYVSNVDKSLLGGISYLRSTSINVVTYNGDDYQYVNNANSGIDSYSWSVFPDNPNSGVGVVDSNYDVLMGKIDTSVPGLIIVVDKYNQVDKNTLRSLGFDVSKNVNFNDLLSKEFKVIFNDSFYQFNNGYYMMGTDYKKMYNDDDSMSIKIQAIIRCKKDKEMLSVNSGVLYTSSLVDRIIEVNKNSKIVNDQKRSDYNILTLQKFDDSATKESVLGYLGDDSVPSYIMLYPKDFDAKEKILSYLDKYNDGKSDNDKILYTDMANMISSLSGSIMDAITLVLIAFSSISLIVSSIMIGIITYISVLERTKEIGILRALGARKKDITRVFNSETFIIGITSGLIGIGIALLLNVPINDIIYKLSDLRDVASLSFGHAIILISVSIILTLIGGFIPAKIASKKDPVVALRSE